MLRTKHYSIITAALLICCATPAQGLAQAVDTVYLSTGAPKSGTVKAMSEKHVVLNQNGIDIPFEVNIITRVSFADDPQELRRGRDAAVAGRYEEALTSLKAVDKNSIERTTVKQDVDFYRAMCQAKLALQGTGDKAAAMTALGQFISTAKSNYHFYAASELYGDVAVSDGKFNLARSAYAAVAKAPWGDYKMRATILSAKVLLADNKYAEALANNQKDANATLNTPEPNRQKLFGRVGAALCQAHTGKPAEGIKTINDIIAKNDQQDMELFGKAYNSLGACYMTQKKEKEAALAYLHTDILFYSDAEVHAEALYHLYQLWEKMQKADRSVRARKLLLQRYPGTRWASLLNK